MDGGLNKYFAKSSGPEASVSTMGRVRVMVLLRRCPVYSMQVVLKMSELETI